MEFDLSCEDKLFYFQKNFFTLDGLWMVVVEDKLGLEETVELDLKVWEQFFPIIYRRIARHLGIEENTLENFIRVLGFRWMAEGWDFTVKELSPTKAVVQINPDGCPYLEILKRAGRPDKMPNICRDVCDPIYGIAARAFSPDISLSRERHQGLEDETCDFIFERKESKS